MDWKAPCLLMCNDGARPGFYRMYCLRGKKRVRDGRGALLQLTHITVSGGRTCIFDHSTLGFLRFNGGSLTRGVQFTMSCHGFHLHNSRNALFMWSAAFLHHPEMGFFSGP